MKKELPILFSAPMVRAILAGIKTQTRRAMEYQPPEGWTPAHYTEIHGYNKHHELDPGIVKGWGPVNEDGDIGYCSRYGRPGDALWVRETWMPDFPQNGEWADVEFFGCGMRDFALVPDQYKTPDHCLYRATWDGADLTGWKPSIHMHRWASRITLPITSIRVERLQDISEADATAEGAIYHDGGSTGHSGWRHDRGHGFVYASARQSYAALWKEINGPEAWDKNPWVWVLEFPKYEAKR